MATRHVLASFMIAGLCAASAAHASGAEFRLPPVGPSNTINADGYQEAQRIRGYLTTELTRVGGVGDARCQALAAEIGGLRGKAKKRRAVDSAIAAWEAEVAACSEKLTAIAIVGQAKLARVLGGQYYQSSVVTWHDLAQRELESVRAQITDRMRALRP